MNVIIHDVAKHGTSECVEHELWKNCTHKHLACGGSYWCKKECENPTQDKRECEQKIYPMRKGKVQEDGTIVWEEEENECD